MRRALRFILNDEIVETDAPPGTPVLDFLRYRRRLTGTKVGCREGDCGACTVLVGELAGEGLSYRSMTSCLMPLCNADRRHVVSVEGLNLKGPTPVQRAIADAGATQCGFCTPGFVVSLTGLCLRATEPSPAEAIAAIDGNICRCTGYKSLERAAARIIAELGAPTGDPLTHRVREGWLPAYFTTIAERLESLSAPTPPRHARAASDDSKAGRWVGGGTDLYVQDPVGMLEGPMSLLYEPALRGVREVAGRVVIGASTTAQELADSPLLRRHLPGIGDHLRLVASTPVRNMATVAGNLVNASPIADLAILFLALDAEVELRSGSRTRRLPLRELFVGYKRLAKAPEERLESISFRTPKASTRLVFEKVSRRTHLDIASVSTALRVEAEDGSIAGASLSAGGVAPIPLYLGEASRFLVGQTATATTARRGAEIALGEVAPIGDVRGSARYKRLLLRQLIYAHFLQLFPDGVRFEELQYDAGLGLTDGPSRASL